MMTPSDTALSVPSVISASAGMKARCWPPRFSPRIRNVMHPHPVEHLLALLRLSHHRHPGQHLKPQQGLFVVGVVVGDVNVVLLIQLTRVEPTHQPLDRADLALSNLKVTNPVVRYRQRLPIPLGSRLWQQFKAILVKLKGDAAALPLGKMRQPSTINHGVLLQRRRYIRLRLGLGVRLALGFLPPEHAVLP